MGPIVLLAVDSSSESIPVVAEMEREAIEPCSQSSIALEADLCEIIHDLVDAPFRLQTMSKGHEIRMATIESTVLKTSQDRALERLQSFETSIAALSESVARRQAVGEPFAVGSCENLAHHCRKRGD